MAYEERLQTVTFEAGQDLSAHQFRFMSVSADGQIDPTGDGAQSDGVLQNDPAAANRAATLAIAGVSKVEAGAAVTRGGPVASDSVGRAVDATTTGDVILGTALQTAGAAGEIIAVLLDVQNRATVT